MKNETTALLGIENFLGSLIPYTNVAEELKATYLEYEVGIAPRNVNVPWNHLSNQLIFPVRNVNGVLYGFGIGSPDSDEKKIKFVPIPQVFSDKVEHLYGLYQAKESIINTGKVYLVQNCHDVIAMHTAGITNCVGLIDSNFSDIELPLLEEYITKAINTSTTKSDMGMGEHQPDKKRQKNIKIICTQFEVNDNDDQRESDKSSVSAKDPGKEPQYSEILLITVCLQSPDVMVRLNGKEKPFAQHVKNILETENIPFEWFLHQTILDEVIRKESNWFENYSQIYLTLCDNHLMVFRHAADNMEDYLKSILAGYMAERLTTLIFDLEEKSKLITDMEEKKEKRKELNYRRKQLKNFPKIIGELQVNFILDPEEFGF